MRKTFMAGAAAALSLALVAAGCGKDKKVADTTVAAATETTAGATQTTAAATETTAAAATETTVAAGGTETTAVSAGTATTAAGGASAAPSGDPIIIGAAMAKTGFMAPFDDPALITAQIEVDKVNAAGGILGRPVQIVNIDTETKPDKYAGIATELLSKGAKVLMVTCDYDISVGASQVAEEKNVLNVAPCVGDPIYGPNGGLKIGFSMGTGTPAEAAIMAEFAASKGWKKAVAFKDTSIKYTQNQCDIFTKRFTELGGTVEQQTFAQGDNSVAEQVSKISAAKPDVVANCSYPPTGALAAKALRDGGYAGPIVSGFGMDGAFWLDGVPNLSNYFVVTYASVFGDDPDPAVKDLLAAFKAKTGKDAATGGLVTGASVIQAIKVAAERAQSLDGDKLAAEFEKFAGEKFTAGPTTYTAKLHINVDRPMRVLDIENGKHTFVANLTAQKVDVAR